MKSWVAVSSLTRGAAEDRGFQQFSELTTAPSRTGTSTVSHTTPRE